MKGARLVPLTVRQQKCHTCQKQNEEGGLASPIMHIQEMDFSEVSTMVQFSLSANNALKENKVDWNLQTSILNWKAEIRQPLQ